MKIIKIDSPQALKLTWQTLKNGGLVICPTETVYGALVDATNQDAVSKLLTYKKRPPQKAISIACADQKMAQKYVSLNQQARELYQKFLPGPVTVISASLNLVDQRLESEKKTLGVRWPAYPFLIEVIKKLAKPVTATSANSHGKKTPYTIDDILKNLSTKQKAQIDLLIDAGELPKRAPSLVIDTTTTTPTLIRDNKNLSWQSTNLISKKISTSPAQTQKIAQELLKNNLDSIKKTGLIIALDGSLGAGKTVFAQGLAQALKIKEHLTSPTYTYLKEYAFFLSKTKGNLYHLDAWTIDNQEVLAHLQLEKILKAKNLLVIEWFAQIKDFLKTKTPILKITLQETKNHYEREILIDPL